MFAVVGVWQISDCVFQSNTVSEIVGTFQGLGISSRLTFVECYFDASSWGRATQYVYLYTDDCELNGVPPSIAPGCDGSVSLSTGAVIGIVVGSVVIVIVVVIVVLLVFLKRNAGRRNERGGNENELENQDAVVAVGGEPAYPKDGGGGGSSAGNYPSPYGQPGGGYPSPYGPPLVEYAQVNVPPLPGDMIYPGTTGGESQFPKDKS
jgi:hypothetical protein